MNTNTGNTENESNNVMYNNMILRFSIDFIILYLNKINLLVITVKLMVFSPHKCHIEMSLHYKQTYNMYLVCKIYILNVFSTYMYSQYPNLLVLTLFKSFLYV